MVPVSTMLSGAVSFGVLAGVFTGVCYLLLFGLKRVGLLRAVLTDSTTPASTASASKSCARCGRRLSTLSLGYGRRLQCAHCRLPVCRHCCVKTTTSRWLCVSCRKLRDVRLQSGEWFYQQLRQRFRSTVAAISNSDKNDGEVQEFMERLIEGIIGDGLDDVALYPLCDKPHYVNFCESHKEPLVQALRRLYAKLKMALSDAVPQDGETACDLHAELKDLMKQMIHEARAHSPLSEENGEPSWPPPSRTSAESLEQRSYEDILATAILNKIFSKYQRDRPRRKRRLHDKTVDRNSNLLLTSKIAASMQEAVGKTDSEDSDSVANSLDDYSWSESSHHEPLSVTIEECIEEVTTRYSSEDEEPKTELDRFLSSLQYIKRQRAPFPEFGKDVVDGGMSSSEEAEGDSDGDVEGVSAAESVTVNPVDSWEENWLFQRRKLKTNVGTCQPVPVPMLVPNPVTDLRAMIGGVEADEMSDLSDCSDSVLEDLVDGPDDKRYFESQFEEESEEEKPIQVLEKQREVFLKCISEDLNKLIEPQQARGLSPDTGQRDEEEKFNYLKQVKTEPTPDTDRSADEERSVVSEQNGSADSPTETDSSNSYSVAEARNLSVPVVQVDSGEGSLDMQQEGEYTVAYATLAQVRPSPSPTPSPSPVPKPRTVMPLSTNDETTEVASVNNVISQDRQLEVTRHPEETKDDEISSLPELSVPPKPGTLAEREHLKWEKAPPLANNPYSKENIVRRQRQRMYLSRHSSSENSIEFPELTGTKEPSLLEIDSKHRRQDYNKYVRDYYVNVAEEREENKHETVPPRPVSAEPRTPSHTCSSQPQVSVKVEVEVAVTKNCHRTVAPTFTQTTAHQQVMTVVTPDVNKSYITLPSVKELAKQFSSPDVKIPTPTSPVPARKQPELRLHSPVRQVHSLTARNISREFRENLRGSTTVPVVKVVSGGDKEPDSSGHISEDSGTVSPTPCPHPPPRRLKIQDDIQFWEHMKQQR